MPKRFMLFVGLLLTIFVEVASAQSNYPIDVERETAYAESEYSRTQYLPLAPTVPHLDPRDIVTAMHNPSFLPGGATPFTFVIAHRGSHTAPGCAENSACSIAEAYNAGADAIELDVKVTKDGEAVLGHDVAIARELNNWFDSTGAKVYRNSNWTPFSVFPVLDPTYQDLNKYPFLNNFTMTDSSDNIIVDPNNPTRSTMNSWQLESGALVDTYNQVHNWESINFQLTLFEALEIIANHYPMSVWLDVKSKDDFAAVGAAVYAAKQQWPNSAALRYISMKLDWKTVSDPSIAGKPGKSMSPYLSADNFYYFLVFGTNQLDSMATYNGIPAPTSPDAANSQAYDNLASLCTLNNGCLGPEISHKYPTAPTADITRHCWTVGCPWQIAGFQTLPQYSWYWQTLAPPKMQAQTYGRTFPRTDGSCCFAPTDSLNISTYLGPETQDLRPLYSWNEATYSTITTDEPLLVLQDLYKQSKRSQAAINAINVSGRGVNLDKPSGGSSPVIRDGLYTIRNVATNQLLDGNVETNQYLSTILPVPLSSAQMWYVSMTGDNGYVTISNAATGLAIRWNASVPPTAQWITSGAMLNWSLLWRGNGYALISQFAADPHEHLAVDDNPGVNNQLKVTTNPAPNTDSWVFTPVTTPSSEVAQQQGGPAGYTYCSDENGTCDFSGKASVAFGANGQFRYLQYVDGPVSCQRSSFGNIDPTPNVVKACFYAPYDGSWGLDQQFNGGIGFEGASLGNVSGQVAFGAWDPGNGALYTYKTFDGSRAASCTASEFGMDPAWNLPKVCFSAVSAPPPPPGSAFTYCAIDGSSCAFSGTALVAYGDSANGRFTYRTFANGVRCWRTSFGMDPDPGVVKACFYLAATPLGQTTISTLPSTFQQCALEGSTCNNVPVGSVIAFGGTNPNNGSANYDFSTILSGTVSCALSTFGNVDPTPGVPKSCYVSPPVNQYVDRGPQGFTYCATEIDPTISAGKCMFTGVAQIAFGIDGNYVFKTITQPSGNSQMVCTQATFGSDPYPGRKKACYYRLY